MDLDGSHGASPSAEAVAIIGMSGRFPGAPDIDRLWDLLVGGAEGVGEAPPDRAWLRGRAARPPGTPGRVASSRGGFLERVDEFDAAFFDMSPREAARTDPQVRLLLETAQEAMLDAGTPADQLARGSTGVFVGGCYGDYWQRQIQDVDDLDIYSELGASLRAALSGRLSYAFDLGGPAITVDSACSSSLSAVHLACLSLRVRECEVALAGGVNLILAPSSSITFSWAGALSPDGRCKFADASADGYVRSEAVGVVVLKPLHRALADGDRIRAVILGGATNNDGNTGSGMAAPSRHGQQRVLRAAYASAGIDPRKVDFVEAHGSGTAAGDPVELASLAHVVGSRRPGDQPCLVGSVKTNIGHCEGAAGIASLIKTVLCLENRMVPASLHLRDPNPAVDWAGGGVTVPREAVRLPAHGRPLYAGVNSFGVTGSNVHLVLSQAPPPPPSRPEPAPTVLLTLSARSPSALRASARAYRDFLALGGDGRAQDLRDVCFSAAARRQHYEYRLAATAESADELVAALGDFLDGRSRPGLSSGEPAEGPRVVFVFPGHGARWAATHRDLLGHNTAFTAALTACDRVVSEVAGWSLLSTLAGERSDRPSAAATAETELWAMGVALTAVWRAWGVEPDAVLGLGPGEIAAAHVAGALSLEQSGELICRRADLLGRLAPPGALAHIGLPETDIPALLADLDANATVAVVNSPDSVVVSGSPGEIDKVMSGCERQGVPCVRLQVDHAAHSPAMDPVRTAFAASVPELDPGTLRVPMCSTVTGALVGGSVLDAEYWGRNTREPVLLGAAVQAQLLLGRTAFVQFSPQSLLRTALLENTGAHDGESLVLDSLRPGHSTQHVLLSSLGALYASGYPVDFGRVLAGQGCLVDLPAHPWQRQRYWHEPDRHSSLLPPETDSADVAASPVAVPAPPTDLPAPPAVAVTTSCPGSVTDLTLRPAERTTPGPGQIEIEVSHAGLNYRDLLQAMGMCPGQDGSAVSLGLECAGTVTRLGDGVTGLAVGDEVVAFAHPSHLSHVVTAACLTVRKPAGLTMAQAATLPIAYGTAYHGLVEMAGLAPGERVLIHSGTGGVGLAALQIARWRGAEVYATAGSPAKRELLRQLGVARVADSRSTAFAETLDDGRSGGVDVVLNTLIGAGVDASFHLLNRFGRFIDLAERNAADEHPLPVSMVHKAQTYVAVDVLDLYQHLPERGGELLRAVVDLVEAETVEPLPQRVYPAADAQDAYRAMARSQHTGKLVLAFPGAPGRSPERATGQSTARTP